MKRREENDEDDDKEKENQKCYQKTSASSVSHFQLNIDSILPHVYCLRHWNFSTSSPEKQNILHFAAKNILKFTCENE